jgi:hypothetical protein
LKTQSVLVKTQSVLVKTQSVLVKTQCVFKSVFIFPINLRIAQKYFGDVTYLRTIFQIRRFLCLPGAKAIIEEASRSVSVTSQREYWAAREHAKQTTTPHPHPSDWCPTYE